MESNSHAITSFRKVIESKPPRYVRYPCTNKCTISAVNCQVSHFWQRLHLQYILRGGIMTVFLQERIPIKEVTEMFCNFDCASLLKLLCGFFGC